MQHDWRLLEEGAGGRGARAVGHRLDPEVPDIHIYIYIYVALSLSIYIYRERER